MHPRFLLAPLAVLPALLSGCVLDEPAERIVYSPCHALGTGQWRAWVERVRDPSSLIYPHQTFLFVEGEVTVPGEGWSASLDRGAVQRLADPVQQIIVRTSGSGTGAAVVRHVAGRFKALKRYGSVSIRCGDGIVAAIPDVPRKG